MCVKKQRFGKVGGKLKYAIDIDRGSFVFIPSYDDAETQEVTEKKVDDIRRKFNDNKTVF